MTPEQVQRPAHTALSRRVVAALVAVVVLVTVVALLNMVNVPKVIYRPGPVYDTLGQVDGNQVVSVEGLRTYPTSGSLDFTTITLSGGPGFPVSAWDYLTALVDPRTATDDYANAFPPDVSREQVREQNLELMQNSQEEAAVVALRAVGEEVPEDVLVAQVLVGAPADGVLSVNDQVTAVDGRPVAGPDEIREVLQEFEPGAEVAFSVVRDGEAQEIMVPTEEGDVPEGESEGPTVIGVYLASDFQLPYEISIDAGNVGGPSAGLMFSLALYDTITPGELTGGREIAGTGTISSAGDVGPIGGIRQKLIGADDAGADLFLAPAGNCAEVVGHVPEGLEVARVETFEQARDIVADVGAGRDVELPRC